MESALSSAHTTSPGRRVPDVVLCEMVGEELVRVRAEALFAGKNAAVVGVPGAFTPICTARHLPEFIAKADRLRASGLHLLLCIAPNDPWTLKRWAAEVDPEGKIRFLSDGNLHFARGLGLVTREENYFLGECTKRYSLRVENAVIQRMAVEKDILDVSCTRPDDLMI